MTWLLPLVVWFWRATLLPSCLWAQHMLYTAVEYADAHVDAGQVAPYRQRAMISPLLILPGVSGKNDSISLRCSAHLELAL